MNSPAPAANKSDEILWDQTVQLLERGVESHKIVAELVRQKWSGEAAQQFVDLAVKHLAEFRDTPAGIAQRKRRSLLDLQILGLWIGGGLILLLLIRVWPKSELLPFIAVFAILYGIYEYYVFRKRKAS